MMASSFSYIFFCRKCRRLRRVRECYREEKVFPEAEPKFDVATWCCAVCGEPIVEVTDLHRE